LIIKHWTLLVVYFATLWSFKTRGFHTHTDT